jgi:hypothetical protein
MKDSSMDRSELDKIARSVPSAAIGTIGSTQSILRVTDEELAFMRPTVIAGLGVLSADDCGVGLMLAMARLKNKTMKIVYTDQQGYEEVVPVGEI